MMLTAIKKALRTRIGLTNLILSVLCILALLALNGLDIGRWTFLVFMVPALASVYFGRPLRESRRCLHGRGA